MNLIDTVLISILVQFNTISKKYRDDLQFFIIDFFDFDTKLTVVVLEKDLLYYKKKHDTLVWY